MNPTARTVVALAAIALSATACDDPSAESGDDVAAQRAEAAFEPVGPVQRAELREDDGVIDGDTLRVVGFDNTVRILCIDTEEEFEHRGDERRARNDWSAYRRDKTEGADGPVDYGTPMGRRATEFAEEFFERHGSAVWLEYESPRRTRGFYGRHLAHVWVRGDGEHGEWINYGTEAVRRGMTPYFTAYGRCLDHHERFRGAQQEARRHRRGIWERESKSYGDYEVRLLNWESRADQVQQFRRRFSDTAGVVELGTDTAMSRLRFKLGRRAVVFGAVDRLVAGADPPRLELFHRHRRPFGVVVDDGVTFDRFGVDVEEAEYVYVFGEIQMYRGDPQMRVDADSFISTGDDPPPIGK